MFSYEDKLLAEDVDFYDVTCDAGEGCDNGLVPFSPQYRQTLLKCYEATQRIMKLLKVITEDKDKNKHLQNQLSVLRFVAEGKNPCRAMELAPRIKTMLSECNIDLEDAQTKTLLAAIVSECIHSYEQFIARGNILDNIFRPTQLRYPLGRDVLTNAGDLKEVLGVNPLDNIEINDIVAARFITDENNYIAGAMVYLKNRRCIRVNSGGEEVITANIRTKKTKIA